MVIEIKVHRSKSIAVMYKDATQSSTDAVLASSQMYVRPHGTTRLPLDGFSQNFALYDFSKIWL